MELIFNVTVHAHYFTPRSEASTNHVNTDSLQFSDQFCFKALQRSNIFFLEFNKQFSYEIGTVYTGTRMQSYVADWSSQIGRWLKDKLCHSFSLGSQPSSATRHQKDLNEFNHPRLSAPPKSKNQNGERDLTGLLG